MSKNKILVPAYPRPPNENERLRAITEFELVGAGAIEQVDRICALARDLFDVPIALVTILNGDRQDFLSACGISSNGTARQDAFCNYTILSDKVFVVPNALDDVRFADNPLVTGNPNIRFYAGAPLAIREGLNVGSLCLIDMVPREFTESDAAHLAALADVIVNEIRGRHDANALKRRKQLLRQTAHMAKIAGWEINYPSGEMVWDDEIYHMYGIPLETPPQAELITARYSEEISALAQREIDSLRRTGKSYDVEYPGTRPNGEKFWVRTIAEAEMVNGHTVRIFGAVQDITARKESEQRIYDLAYRDTLTKLPNRAQFQEKLEEAIRVSHKTGAKFGLLMLDVDHFKDVNDTFGHQAGDLLLGTVAERLRRIFRPIDTVARIGGDEFAAIILGLKSIEDIKDIAESMILRLKTPIQHENAALTIGASIGYSVFPLQGQTAEQILKNADIAMYGAKAQGRGRAVAFEPGMLHAIEERAGLFQEIRLGIARNEFLLHYQPIVGLQSNKVSGLEALMRWNHPTRGILAPLHFMAGLEYPDISLVLGEVALDTALKQMREWMDQEVPFGSVAVNLSSSQFRLPDLAERILAKLVSARVPPDKLTLEVTENVYMAWGADTVVSTVNKLHDAGVGIALDDFGTGYASLTHLRQFPIDHLKIDKSFVQSPGSATIVDAVINMGLSLGMKVVAEGVEKPEQLGLLRMKGCDYVQGYIFAKAMEPSQVSGFIAGFDVNTSDDIKVRIKPTTKAVARRRG